MLKHIKNTLKSLALNVTLSAALFGAGATLSNAGAARAAVLPPGFTETQVGGGLTGPTAMALAPDGRVFACEQRGRLRVIKNGVLLPTSFVNVTVDSSVERGLIGVVLHPNFATNGWVYIYYTQPAAEGVPARNRIVRYTAQGDVAAANSATPIFNLSPLGAAGNHNGGAMHFGPDGKLYVAVGENAYPPNAQSLATLHGKILRINEDGTIPTNNPFYDQTTGDNRAIYALGVRNPFTFDIDPVTARIFANDVGENTWEEINKIEGGSNYGWPFREGYGAGVQGGGTGNYVAPFYAYEHGDGPTRGCSVTGGAFYRGTQFPGQYNGKYFFNEFCNGWIRALDPVDGTTELFATGLSYVVDLKSGPDGALYYLSRGTGAVYRISHSGVYSPTITTPPADLTVSQGQNATFFVQASGTAPLSYQWQRNGVDIPGATTSSYTVSNAPLTESGARFRVVVTNPSGSATSQAALLTVIERQPPTVTITSTSAIKTYTAGQSITVEATATDANGTVITNPLNFVWAIDFHHADHVHPFRQPTTGRSQEFTPPTTGHTETNVFYRARVTVTDAQGTSTTKALDFEPNKSTFTLRTEPAGLTLLLDGQPFAATTPRAVEGVVGVVREVNAPTTQFLGGDTYEFTGWSDGGAATHTFATPAADTTLTATYRRVVADTTAPSVFITTPAGWEQTYTASQVRTAAGTAGDEAGGSGLLNVRLRLRRLSDGQYWNGTGWKPEYFEVSQEPQANWTFAMPNLAGTAPTTRYGLLAIAQDKAFNQGYAYTEFFVTSAADTTVPTVTIDFPSRGPGSYPAAEVRRAYGTVSDEPGGSGLNRVTAIFRSNTIDDRRYWNGQSWQTEPFEFDLGTASPWSLPLPNLARSEFSNRYWLQVFAYDNAGNGQTSITIFSIDPTDQTAPIATITTPVSGFSYGTSAEARGTVADGGRPEVRSGVESVRLAIGRLPAGATSGPLEWWNGNGGWGSAEFYFAATVSGSTWSGILPALNRDGTYTLKARPFDIAGNFSQVTTDFYVDTVAPVATISNITSGYSYRSVPSVTGTATDARGVSQVRGALYNVATRQWWNGSAWSTAYAEVVASGTNTWSRALPALPALADGRYAYYAIARDYRGNTSVSPPVEFWIDTLAPEVTIETPRPNTPYASLERATGTARDAGPGVFAVRGRLQQMATGRWWNGSAWVTAYTEVPATLSAGSGGTVNWTWSLPPAAQMPNGRYAFSIAARDYIGNTRSSSVVEFDKSAGQLVATRTTRGAGVSFRPDPKPAPTSRVLPRPVPKAGAPVAAPPAAAPVSGISIAAVDRARGQVTLRFLSPLAPRTAVEVGRYAIWAGTTRVAIERVVFSAPSTVTIQLSPGALAAGDSVLVSWTNLPTQAGKAFTGRTSLIVR